MCSLCLRGPLLSALISVAHFLSTCRAPSSPYMENLSLTRFFRCCLVSTGERRDRIWITSCHYPRLLSISDAVPETWLFLVPDKPL